MSYPLDQPVASSEIANRTFDSDNDSIKVSVVEGGSSSPDALGNGTKTVAATGTAEQLAADTACTAVILTPLSTNTGIVYIGGSTVEAATENGFPLDQGMSITIEVDNLNDVWLDPAVSGEGVAYIYTAVTE